MGIGSFHWLSWVFDTSGIATIFDYIILHSPTVAERCCITEYVALLLLGLLTMPNGRKLRSRNSRVFHRPFSFRLRLYCSVLEPSAVL